MGGNESIVDPFSFDDEDEQQDASAAAAEVSSQFMSIEDYERQNEEKRKKKERKKRKKKRAAAAVAPGDGDADAGPRRRSVRLSVKGDPNSAGVSLLKAEPQDAVEFDRLRRRHSAMPSPAHRKRLVPGSSSAEDGAAAGDAQAELAQPAKSVRFAPKKSLATSITLDEHWDDRLPTLPNLFSCDHCGRQFDAGLGGFENYWSSATEQEFDACTKCVPAVVAANPTWTFTETDPTADPE